MVTQGGGRAVASAGGNSDLVVMIIQMMEGAQEHGLPIGCRSAMKISSLLRDVVRQGNKPALSFDFRPSVYSFSQRAKLSVVRVSLAIIPVYGDAIFERDQFCPLSVEWTMVRLSPTATQVK